jgi:hypothetical protein
MAQAAEALRSFAQAAGGAATDAGGNLAAIEAALEEFVQRLAEGNNPLTDMRRSTGGVADFLLTLARLSRHAQLLAVNASIEAAHRYYLLSQMAAPFSAPDCRYPALKHGPLLCVATSFGGDFVVTLRGKNSIGLGRPRQRQQVLEHFHCSERLCCKPRVEADVRRSLVNWGPGEQAAEPRRALQGLPFRCGDDRPVRPLVSWLQALIPRSRRNDGRARGLRRAEHDSALGAALYAGVREALESLCTTGGRLVARWMRRTSRFVAAGCTSIAPWMPAVRRSTFA